MAENDTRLERARQLFLRGDYESFAEANNIMRALGYSEIEISRFHDEWNEQFRQRGTGTQASGSGGGIRPPPTSPAATPGEPHEEPERRRWPWQGRERREVPFINLIQKRNRLKFWQREGREEQIARTLKAVKKSGRAAEGTAATATGRFLQRTPGYQYASKPVGYAAEHTSSAVQKTPVVGDILYGKVGPAARMESLPPAVRSAINKGRIMLQKQSTGVRDELTILQKQAETEFNTKKAQLEGVKREIEKIKNEFRKEKGKEGTPQAEAEKDERGGAGAT